MDKPAFRTPSNLTSIRFQKDHERIADSVNGRKTGDERHEVNPFTVSILSCLSVPCQAMRNPTVCKHLNNHNW